MLTRELAIVEFKSGRAYPDRLTQRSHAKYVRYAEQAVQVYRDGVGRVRQDLHRAVRSLFQDEFDCPTRRIDSFCKLLDEKGSWDRDTRGKAANLRREVFRSAAPFHPLVCHPDRFFEHNQKAIKDQIAEQRNTTWESIEASLFADVIQFHRLHKFEGFERPTDLLARYNVAQTQVALFDAVRMTVIASQDFKWILRYAKLAGLMHTITRNSQGDYRFEFDGPASILGKTRRYGVAMAKFLPGLLSCKGWRMQAILQRNSKAFVNVLELSDSDKLTSNVAAADEFDSTVESKLAEKWGGQPREGWTMVSEGEVLHDGQTVFVPDFVFQHRTGVRILLEIVGFWTPEYLKKKTETLKRFEAERILVAAALSLGDLEGLDANYLLRYKTTIALNDLLLKLNTMLAASHRTTDN